MSTILTIRNLKLPGVARTALFVGTVVVLGIVGGLIGWNVYKKLTTNTVVAYFPTRWLCPLTPLGRALFRRVRRS
jgi:phospholipid/cholesterol/gamma-HCH transport system substrate-binding protein